MLYLIATPIGNLGDLTFRARDQLMQADYVLCEDTRRSKILLERYGIEKPLKSYHAFNEAKREEEIVEDLKNGLSIALVSDAGTPGISDPGHRLVQRCIKEKISYTLLPGPSAPLQALVLSGFDPLPFQCLGFLPQTAGERRTTLAKILLYEGTSLCLEGPSRIHETLEEIEKLAPQRPLAIARELTKLHETILIGTASRLKTEEIRGELVLVISKAPALDFGALTPQEHVIQLQETYGLTKQEAIKLVAQIREIPKRDVYF